jgi:hypothetical protein
MKAIIDKNGSLSAKSELRITEPFQRLRRRIDSVHDVFGSAPFRQSLGAFDCDLF